MPGSRQPRNPLLFCTALCLSVAFSVSGCDVTSTMPTSISTVSMPTSTTSKLIERMDGQSPSPNMLAWSPDSTRVAVASSFTPLRVWDIASSRPVAEFAVTAANHGLSWSADGKSIAIAAIQPTDKLQVWDVANTDRTFNADPGSGATEVAWSPGGERLAVASSGHIKDKNFSVEGGAIFLYDPSTWTQLRMLPYAGFVGSLSWAPDNNRLVFASTTGDLKETDLVVWDLNSDKTSHIGESLPGSGTDVKWSPDGVLIAVDSGESSVALIDPTSGRVVRQMAHGDKVISISWSPDSKRIATAGQSGAIKVWEASSGNLLTTLDQGVLLTSMAWSPDGNYLASTGAGNSLCIWDAR